MRRKYVHSLGVIDTSALTSGIKPSTPTLAIVKPTAPATTPVKTNWWDVLSSVSNSAATVAQGAANTISSIKTGGQQVVQQYTPGQSSSGGNSNGSAQPSSNTGLYIGLAAGALALGGGAYMLLRKKKKPALSGVKKKIRKRQK